MMTTPPEVVVKICRNRPNDRKAWESPTERYTYAMIRSFPTELAIVPSVRPLPPLKEDKLTPRWQLLAPLFHNKTIKLILLAYLAKRDSKSQIRPRQQEIKTLCTDDEW